jgi:hypothetical protein
MEPVQVGANSYNGNQVGGPRLIIDPKKNVAGVVIRTGMFVGSAGSRVTTGPTVSSFIESVTNVLVAIADAGLPHQLQYPILLPPGYGLWSFGAGSGSVVACITYDFL